MVAVCENLRWSEGRVRLKRGHKGVADCEMQSTVTSIDTGTVQYSSTNWSMWPRASERGRCVFALRSRAFSIFVEIFSWMRHGDMAGDIATQWLTKL